MARCSRCGMEYDMELFVCDNCGYILKRESIERIPIFKRPDAKVYKPNKPIIRIAKIIYPMTTPYAFRDINHKKDKAGVRRICLLSALFFALWIWAIIIQVDIPSNVTNMTFGFGDEEQSFEMGTMIFYRLYRVLVVLIFFIFGLIYYRITIFLYNFAFKIAANFSVQLDDILAVRFNVKRKKNRFQTVLSGSAVLRRNKLNKEEQFAFEKAAKGEKVLTKISQTGINKVLNYAYAPFIVVNALSFIVVLIGLLISGKKDLVSIFGDGTNAIWVILDILQIIGMLWIAALVSIAQREVGNTNTTRLLIGNMIMAFIISFTTIMLRPTLGAGDWNIIDRFSASF